MRKLKGEFCQPCVTRLKQIAGAKEDSEYWKVAEILKEGCERERLKLCKKLTRRCSEGYNKHKTKIDEVKAEKKALRERLRRSEARVRQLEGLLA